MNKEAYRRTGLPTGFMIGFCIKIDGNMGAHGAFGRTHSVSSPWWIVSD